MTWRILVRKSDGLVMSTGRNFVYDHNPNDYDLFENEDLDNMTEVINEETVPLRLPPTIKLYRRGSNDYYSVEF